MLKYLLVSFLALGSLSGVAAEEKKSLLEQQRIAQESVAKFSQMYPDVLMTSQQFLSAVIKAHEAGEGFIDSDLVRIFEALEFAAKKHQFQEGKNPGKVPYIIHPIGVAHHLLTVGNVRDPDIIIGALLHDTVEDTDASFVEIRARFGEKVEGFVREMTDNTALTTQERINVQIMTAPQKSAGAAQIHLAEKWCNLKAILQAAPEGWDKSQIDAYVEGAQKVVNALPWVNAPLKKAVDDTIKTYQKN